MGANWRAHQEAKQEETPQRHQRVCPHGAGASGNHAAVERVLLEERTKRCQMEVSLYTQAIEFIAQHWLCELCFRVCAGVWFDSCSCSCTSLVVASAGAPAELDISLIGPPLRRMHAFIGCVPVPCAPLACSIETREVGVLSR